MSIKDRRAIQRFQAKAEDCILYDEKVAPVRDVSLSGIFVMDQDPLPVGSDIAFTFRAGHSDISLEGIVRHSVDQVGMGIQFTNVAPVSKRRLIIHIATLAPAPFELEILT
jgi:PilZ domain